MTKVEWHHGELLPRVGFVVTNLRAQPQKMVGFYTRITHINGEVSNSDAKKLAVGASQRASQQRSPEAPNG